MNMESDYHRLLVGYGISEENVVNSELQKLYAGHLYGKVLKNENRNINTPYIYEATENRISFEYHNFYQNRYVLHNSCFIHITLFPVAAILNCRNELCNLLVLTAAPFPTPTAPCDLLSSPCCPDASFVLPPSITAEPLLPLPSDLLRSLPTNTLASSWTGDFLRSSFVRTCHLK